MAEINYKEEVIKIYPMAYIGEFVGKQYGVIESPQHDEDFMCIPTFITHELAWKSAYEQLLSSGKIKSNQ